MRAETVERKMEERFNSMIQQRYQFSQMAGRLLLTYIGGGVKRQSKPPRGQTVSTSKGRASVRPRLPIRPKLDTTRTELSEA